MWAAIGGALLSGLGFLAAPFKAIILWVANLIIEKIIANIKEQWALRQDKADQAKERDKLQDNLNKANESGTKEDRDKAIDDIMHH